MVRILLQEVLLTSENVSMSLISSAIAVVIDMTNNADTDQTPRFVASDLGLHFLLQFICHACCFLSAGV